jgi:hypothetical protein
VPVVAVDAVLVDAVLVEVVLPLELLSPLLLGGEEGVAEGAGMLRN